MLNKIKKQKIKLGNIYEIALPNGKKAYGRLFREYTLAIYEKLGDDVSEIPEDNNYRFFVGVYKDLLQDGVWPVVAIRTFSSDDEAWAPPKCIVDAITNIGSLYYKGKIVPCSYEECKDLEVASVWDREHVVDRIMGIDTWEKTIRRPINPNA